MARKLTFIILFIFLSACANSNRWTDPLPEDNSQNSEGEDSIPSTLIKSHFQARVLTAAAEVNGSNTSGVISVSIGNQALSGLSYQANIELSFSRDEIL